MPSCGRDSGGAGGPTWTGYFQWPVLIARYAEFLESVAERGRGVPGLF